MNRFCLICTFLCVPFLNKTFGQNFQEGDSLLKRKQYDLALLAYERAYFEISEFSDTTLSSNSLQEARNNCILRKAYCLKTMGKYVEASKTAQRLELNNLSDSSQFLLRNEIVVCYFLSGFYEDALSQIQQIRFFIKDSTLTQQTDIWEILSLVHLKRYTEAKVIFKKYLAYRHISMDVDEVFSFEKKTGFRNPKKAEALATFLPGAGMIYSGKVKEGVTSLILQLATLGYGGYSIWKGYYFSGFFSGFGLFQAFYFGGIRRAGVLAEQRNKSLTDNYAQYMTKVIMTLEE